MDADLIETQLPRYWDGVKKNHVSAQEEFEFFCFDTETCVGRVFASGFYDGKKFQHLHGDGKDHFGWLIDRVMGLTGKGHRTMVGSAHYLSFDLSVLLWPYIDPRKYDPPSDDSLLDKFPIKRAPRKTHFSHLRTGVEVEIFWTKPCFAKLRKGKRTIYLIDTWSFFSMSLDKALKALGSEVSKLAKPKGLGLRVIPEPEVLPYLREDCRGGYELLSWIGQLHHKYQTRLCYSLPMMSARVFRHAFMQEDFARPSGSLIQAAMLSYHGGKNTFAAKPGWYKDCYDLDINSAYPEAMRQLPDFEHGEWVFVTDKTFHVSHVHGIYQIWGLAEPCKWPILYTHDFHPATGVLRGLWVTGYELKEALASKELRLDHVQGYAYVEGADAGVSAFKEFVDHFYELRMQTKDPVWRLFYKLILNSLYGKFIQRNEEEAEDGQVAMVAGSCFDPAIASLITGYVRARLHRLEHKYQSLHTATDGLITQTPPDPADLGTTELGKLKCEHNGTVAIFRNKLYVIFGKDGRPEKSGLHGFEESTEKLLQLYRQAERIYKTKRMTRISEAWHTGIAPGIMLERTKKLSLPPLSEFVGMEEALA